MDEAEKRIKKYLKNWGKDPDSEVLKTTGIRQYRSYLLTGDETLRDAALGIWKKFGFSKQQIQDEISEAKRDIEIEKGNKNKLS